MKANVIGKSSSQAERGLGGRFADFFTLTKPTITLLVAVTVVPSLLLAAGFTPDLARSIAAIIGASLASASAAVFNQLVESDLDVRMNRTRGRSLASGRVLPESAGIFGLILGLAGLGILWFLTTPLAALVALAGHLFYVCIYTMILKKRTDQNIVIGGAAGAVGPLIGWAAMTGELGWPAWVLFLIIFLWTPPHFWALALKYKDDYARAGIPMYPCVHGDHKTRRLMFIYTLTLIPCVVAVFFHSHVGYVYLTGALFLTLKFAADAFWLYRAGDNERAMPFFHYSCLYVFGVFGFLTLDGLLRLL